MKKIEKFPKKAKLITDGGFYKIIDIDGFKPVLTFPLTKRVTIASPETNIFDSFFAFDVEFKFMGVKGGMAIYQQFNVTTSVAK